MYTINTNNKSIEGGSDMNLISFVLETIKEGGCDAIRIQNYTLEEWSSFKQYIKEYHIRCVLLNMEYVRSTRVLISDRAIKQHYDIMLDRPHEYYKEIVKEYNGDYEWNIKEEAFIKAHGNMVRGCGTIVHTSNKSYID